jgi:hypothetical protein
MDGCVAHDLGASLVAGVGREAVLEDGDVIGRLGDLGLEPAGFRRAQRAVVGGRMVRAVLSPRRDGDPFLEEGIPAQLAQELFS